MKTQKSLMLTHDGVHIHHISDTVYALNIRNSEVAPQLVINVTEEQMLNCKHFSTREARSMWLEKRNSFIDYVLSFYGEGGIYEKFFNPVLNRGDIILSTNAIDKVGLVGMMSASSLIDEGDSISRELIRDYMFCVRGGINVEYPITKVWFDKNVSDKRIEHQLLIRELW